MLLYYTNGEKLADRYENLFVEQTSGYNEFNNIMHNYSLRNNSNVLIRSQNSGTTGLVCAFPDDSFINAKQVPPADPENILFVVKFFGDRVNTLKSRFIQPTNPNSRYVMSGLRFDGMLITSPDEHASFVIPPIRQGAHYDHLPILNGNSNEEGRILFGGVKHLEKKFIFKGEELTINKPSFMHHRESYKGTVFNVISKLSIGDKNIGTIYSATLNTIAEKDLLGLPNGTVTTVDRLYAFFNDAYVEHIGVLFAYYHIKRMGLAISKFTYEFSGGIY